MNRRGFIRFLAFGAVAASGIEPLAVRAGWSAQIARNVSNNNALYMGYELIRIPAPPGGVLSRG